LKGTKLDIDPKSWSVVYEPPKVSWVLSERLEFKSRQQHSDVNHLSESCWHLHCSCKSNGMYSCWHLYCDPRQSPSKRGASQSSSPAPIQNRCLDSKESPWKAYSILVVLSVNPGVQDCETKWETMCFCLLLKHEECFCDHGSWKWSPTHWAWNTKLFFCLEELLNSFIHTESFSPWCFRGSSDNTGCLW
jgi:hypothetical protein